ncbi:hypothetical protein VNI00_015047 [Paramarasmius palmivorus]|uniref:Major facilitator superfamily MFS-1 n=1 Tax=Paramarasmius palmivorus TaxID=297713 RepID=A0AAW0BN19_9AGAR
MTLTKSLRLSLAQKLDNPGDDCNDDTLNAQDADEDTSSSREGGTGIPVFRSFSISDIWNRNTDCDTPTNERPPIPSLIPPTGEVYYATPLPKLSMVVLSIAMLSEFLSANVSAPFMLFMVKGFGVFTEDADVAFWTGILVSMFFLTQFLTSLLWATLAERYSPRLVLTTCLLGGALSTLLFGSAQSLLVAMIARLAQGVFAGSIGVAKSSVGVITDSTNEGRAYAILGFCWGFGGVAGAVVGGTFERPVDKWPDVFGAIPFFVELPYFLPCSLAASLMLLGAFLACFLAPDVGPRKGTSSFRLSAVNSIRRLSQKISKGFDDPVLEENTPLVQTQASMRPISNYSAVASRQGYPLDRNQTMTMSSTRSGRVRSRYGSLGRRSARDAHISGIVRPRAQSTASFVSGGDNDTERGDESGNRRLTHYASDLSLVHKMVLANENLVRGGIADLWVAAAISMEGDGGDQDRLDEDDLFTEEEVDVNEGERNIDDNRGRRVSFTIAGSPSRMRARSTSTSAMTQNAPSRLVAFGTPTSPAFTRTDVPDRFFPRSDTIESNVSNFRAALGEPALPPILETRRLSNFEPVYPPPACPDAGPGPSMMADIPVLVIIQYGLLALHSTTHDQVFMSYLVSPYEGGGLNLTAGDFAQLIATMCLFQIFYQFYLYPNVGPPRGPFSHLTIFRVGCLLFIPSYVSAIFLRNMVGTDGDGNSVLMIALTGGTAIRYCGSTFGYTAISILLNYMTPPHAIGYANGIAQSIVSLARCIGPVFGGWYPSRSVRILHWVRGVLSCMWTCRAP